MPALEIAQETGKLIAWRKKEGESVTKGELLFEIETDKAVLEVEAAADGILTGIKATEGAVIPVGQTIAWIVRPGEAPPPDAAPPESAKSPTVVAARRDSTPVPDPEKQDSSSTKISPKARRLAKENNVDISLIRGTGPSGEILASDVLAAVKPQSAPLAAVEALSSIGRLMAERTALSWTTVPHFFVVREIEASALLTAREHLGQALEKDGDVKLTHTDLLVALVARALVKHPRLNASWMGEGIRLNPEINIGIAMAVNDGVVAAVIHNAHSTSLTEIAMQRRELADRARAGKLRPADISGATFTISNLGMYQVDAFNAIISPPQAAILAVGRIADRVVPVDGRPGIRPIMTLTLSSDHRVVDGVRAAAFLNEIADAIREPEKWLH